MENDLENEALNQEETNSGAEVVNDGPTVVNTESGARGNSFMQQSVARGFQAAGENGGGTGLGFMRMGINSVGATMGAFQQPVQPAPQPAAAQPAPAPQSAPAQAAAEDPYEKLGKMKKLLDDGIISQEEFDEAKKKVLGV